ncbi:hypothetical protein [uncultured Mediterranean phage uvMED]|nr:hypothetical protein [uncultured Mediterranean phage uvMED]
MNNMINAITYSRDFHALNAELRDKKPDSIIEDGSKTKYLVTKTPSVRNETESLSLCRFNSLDSITGLEYLEVLAYADESVDQRELFNQVFSDPDKKAIYDRIYPREEFTVEMDDEVITCRPPLYFGLIA